MTRDFLDLQDIVIGSARGRRQAAGFQGVVIRELNEADLEVINNPPDYASSTTPLVKIRHTHHLLARLLAEGRKPGECGLITGYSPSRVSILQRDPAFQELIEYYKTQAQEVFINVHERLSALGLAAIDELQERLENEPDKISDNMLLEIGKQMLDRTVTKPNAPPASGGAGLNLNVTFVQSPHLENEALAPKLGAKVGEVIEGSLTPEGKL
jgi:hypothetical protein